MHDYKYMDLLHAVSNAFQQAGGTFHQAFPQVQNPFHTGCEQVMHLINMERNNEAQREYNFGGITCMALLDKYRTAKMLHTHAPAVFEEPPVIVWPPALEDKATYADKETLRLWLTRHCDSLPATFTLHAPAYHIAVSQIRSVSAYVTLNLYGEAVETRVAHDYECMLTPEQLYGELERVAGKPLGAPVEEDPALYPNALTAFRIALRDLRQTLWQADVCHEETHQHRSFLSDLMRELDSSNNTYYSNKHIWELRLAWRLYYYRLESLFPQFVDHWGPLVIEPLPEEPEKESE